MASQTSSIDLTYIYKLSIVKIKSIGSNNANQATTIRKDTSTLRKLVLINTFIERKMAFYEELLLAKRKSANMNIGCGKIANNTGVAGNGVRVKVVNVARPDAGGDVIYSNSAANISGNDHYDYEEDESDRPTSPPPPYSPPSSPVYQVVQKEYPSKHDFNKILIPVQVHRNVFHPAEQAQYQQQQYHLSQRGYYNQLQQKEPQKAVQRILIPLPGSPKQFANVPPPRYAPALPPSHQLHLVKVVQRQRSLDG
ncbi:13881_t:CDS:2, partial [Acaulospora morrowiae]